MMKKTKKYSKLIRTTVGEFISNPNPYNGSGVYVVACYPAMGVLYVGRSRYVSERIAQHLCDDERMGSYMRANMLSSCGWRLDVLIPPLDVDTDEWLKKTEDNLLQLFSPKLNYLGVNGTKT
jgi:hypothetical protein